MQSYGDYTFHGHGPRVSDDTDEWPALDSRTLPADEIEPPSCYDEIPAPDPTDDGIGCDDAGQWQDADGDLWAFGACCVAALVVIVAVWMFAGW